MKFGSKKSQSSDSAITGGPLSGGVTKENYADLARRFVETHGGEGFVIRGPEPSDSKRPTPAQWRAWIEYFSDRRVPTTFMRQHGLATVPTEWPEDFDLTAPLSDRLWTPLAPLGPEQAPTIEERRANVTRFNGLIKPLPNDHRRRTPLEHTAPVRNEMDYRDKPLAVSEELKQSNAVRDIALLHASQDESAA